MKTSEGRAPHAVAEREIHMLVHFPYIAKATAGFKYKNNLPVR